MPRAIVKLRYADEANSRQIECPAQFAARKVRQDVVGEVWRAEEDGPAFGVDLDEVKSRIAVCIVFDPVRDLAGRDIGIGADERPQLLILDIVQRLDAAEDLAIEQPAPDGQDAGGGGGDKRGKAKRETLRERPHPMNW